MNGFSDNMTVGLYWQLHNGHSEHRGIGPQNEWYELGPLAWAVKYLPPRYAAGWRWFMLKNPGGCGSTTDNGEGVQIPLYEFDELLSCRYSDDPKLQRIWNELPEMVKWIRKTMPATILDLYGGRLIHHAMYLIDKTYPDTLEMTNAFTEVMEAVRGFDTLYLDNAIPKENSAEFALMKFWEENRSGDDVRLGIEPLVTRSTSHLLKFDACISAGYADETGLGTSRSPYFIGTGARPTVLGYLKPGSPFSAVVGDAYRWSAIGCAYLAQAEMVPLETPKQSLGMIGENQ